MLLVITNDIISKHQLISNAAPKSVKIQAIRTPISKNSVNNHKYGGTPIGYAMRAAIKASVSSNMTIYCYDVSPNAKPALSIMKLSGWYLKAIEIDDYVMHKALFISDILLYSYCVLSDNFFSGDIAEFKREKELLYISQIDKLGLDGCAYIAEAKQIYDDFTVQGVPKNINFATQSMELTIKCVALVLYKAINTSAEGFQG